ncbi:uncharacterized protein BXIN_0405 [Babesia sp. Xinjiang]|uniref:uncharacterized protein n=1 Tax=Babesia sp. Xinjiang TaxID=462227 RepID=UPI000A262C37|nr:uncharacterized protein BXIN_0405 [Babesia sp. Xinjiang]ORM41059.1 hypothetical protein BXIN_0405 [Babesia sp. Xinjiang]
MVETQVGTVVASSALLRMYRAESAILSLCYVKDKKSVEGLAGFLSKCNVRTLNLVNPAHPSIFTHVLQEIALVENKLEVLHIDLWSNGAPELIELLQRALAAHSETLLELSLKCRFQARFVAQLLPLLPSDIEILDLSENILSDSTFLQPLVDFIKCSELHILRLANCSIKSHVVDEFVKRLLANSAPISLDALDGLDISGCEEIPKTVSCTLKDPPAKTRKDLMGYSDFGVPPHRGSNVQFLDYLKSSLLMRRLVGSHVRVWWPPSFDEQRGAFAGRFWPAKVLRVNPIDMVVVVEYDNQEVDHVPCKFIQPESPFLFGGGLNTDFLRSLLGTSYFNSLSDELKVQAQDLQMNELRQNSEQKVNSTSSVLGSEGGTVDAKLSVSQHADPKDPSQVLKHAAGGTSPVGGIKDLNTESKTDVVGNGTNSAVVCGDATRKDTVDVSTNEIVGKRTRSPDEDKDDASYPVSKKLKSEEQNSGSDANKCVNHVGDTLDANTPPDDRALRASSSGPNLGMVINATLSPKEFVKGDAANELCRDYRFIPAMLTELMLASKRRKCDPGFPNNLADVPCECKVNIETMAGLNIGFSGNVLQPGDVCEFRDPLDSDGSDPSDYVVVVKEVNQVEPLYKVTYVYQDDEDTLDVYSNDVRRLVLLPWYLWVSLVMTVERHLLLSKRLSQHQVLQTTLADCLLCPKKRDPGIPFKRNPPNPLELKLQSLSERASEVQEFSSTHPRLTAKRVQRQDDNDSIEGLRYKLRTKQRKLDVMVNLYKSTRGELEQEKELTARLQAKLNCVVCFEKLVLLLISSLATGV